jgi:endonuclease/exonuclease/phosphatase family metal-dependent hydrolase
MKLAHLSKKRVLLLLLVLALAGSLAAVLVARGSPPRDPIDAPPDLVVATYNVNFGLEGDPEGIEAMRATGADVLLLQETTAEWERVIRAELADLYPHMWFVPPDGIRAAGGQGIVSRFPLSDLATSPSEVGWFVAGRAIVETPHGAVTVVNVHLEPPISRSGSWIAGYFETPSDREAEMRAHLAALVPEGLPAFVAGDFNEARGGGLGVLEARGMISALPEFSSATTWRWPVGSFELTRTMDHVVYDPSRIECLDARVLDAGRSDHLPVVAELRFVRG